MTLEWQVSSPPPIFNFDEIPQVVGGPYEYGVPGARHAILSAPPTPNRCAGRPLSCGDPRARDRERDRRLAALLDTLRERAASGTTST